MKEGWEIKKLGDLATYINGYPFKPTEWADDGLPIIRIQNLNSAKDEFHYCNSPIPSKYLVHNGDILISWSASLGVYTWEKGNAYLNQHIFRVAFDKEPINKRFFQYAVSHKLDEMRKLVHGATMQHITKGKFDGIGIPIPSLSEQQRIVDLLDKEFEKIDRLRSNAELNLQHAKAFFQVTSDTFFNKPNSPVSTMGEECSFIRGPFGGSLKKSCFVEKGYPVYEQQNAIYNKFTFRYFIDEEKYQEMKRFTANVGDLIMSCSGTIGKVAIVPETAPIGIINQALLKLTPSPSILSRYLQWYMRSNTFNRHLANHAQGAAIQNVASVAILKQIPLPLPSIKEQNNIVNHLDELSIKCKVLQENYTKTIALCNDLKQALLRKAFNGEL